MFISKHNDLALAVIGLFSLIYQGIIKNKSSTFSKFQIKLDDDNVVLFVSFYCHKIIGEDNHVPVVLLVLLCYVFLSQS